MVDQARGSEGGGTGRGRVPWSRALLVLAVAGPPLWLGGVKPELVPVFAALVAALLVRRCLRSEEPLRIPRAWWLGLVAAAVTALQWLPMPQALVELIAPGLSHEVDAVLAGTQLSWSRLSVHPGQTGLELARLLALTGLFVAAAQLSWRLVVSYVAATGTVVALIGLVQKLVGAEAIYGVYIPRQRLAGIGQELGDPLLTSFVNPNHQSGLLLVGLFAAASMAYDATVRSRETRARRESQRLADRAYLAGGAIALQATALVLSMSRAALVTLIVVAPLAVAVVLRGPPHGREREASRPTRRRQIALALVVLGMVGLALSQGALGQLASLRNLDAFHDKFHVARTGLELVELSPVLGIGRGAFVDLFALVDGESRAIQFTHLESTPVAFVVEWGPLAGGVIVIGLAAWWIESFVANTGPGRRLAMLGLLALAIQSCADFSLDYLGVSAAAVALAGSLSRSSARVQAQAQAQARAQARTKSSRSGKSRPSKTGGWPPRRVLVATLLLLALAEVVAIVSIPSSWSHRRPRDLELLALTGDGTGDVDGLEQRWRAALADTPFDAFVHLGLARVHAAEGEWQLALTRAEVATRLFPGLLDAHLMATVAAAELGAPLESIEHLRRGLEGVREPVPPGLVEYLCAGASPEQITSVAPRDPGAWTALTRAIARHSPAHARALAAERARTQPDEFEPLRLMTRLALDQDNPGLALHYARLAVAQNPHEVASHRLRAHARLAHKIPAQDRAAVEELELAREDSRIRELSAIDELLVIALIRVGEGPALDRAQAVLDELATRRADRDDRDRREVLAERLAQARGRLR